MSRRLRLSIVSRLGRLISAPYTFGQARTAEGDVGKKVYHRGRKSVVCVLPLKGSKAVGVGSGSVVDVKRKWVLTNYHVVADTDKTVILFPAFQRNKAGKLEVVAEKDFYYKRVNERGIVGKVIDKRADCDLAIIELASLPEGALALPLARDNVSPGDRVHSVGNPGASDALWIYTSGTVRQVYKKKYRSGGGDGKPTLEIEARVVETQSPTNRGDSGGPLVNDRAELVAVTQGGHFSGDTRLVSYFIEVGEVQRLSKAKGLRFVVTAPVTSPRPQADATSDRPPTSQGGEAERTEQAANRKLNQAKELAQVGKSEKAREYCETIITKYPNTKAAVEAKKLLQKLKE